MEKTQLTISFIDNKTQQKHSELIEVEVSKGADPEFKQELINSMIRNHIAKLLGHNDYSLI